MVYDLSHLLLGVVWVTQVQDSYLTMIPYLVSSTMALFSMLNSRVTKIFSSLWRISQLNSVKRERERTLSPGEFNNTVKESPFCRQVDNRTINGLP